MAEEKRKQVMCELHQKWREAYPNYPINVDMSGHETVSDGNIMYYDVVFYNNEYFLVFAIEPLTASFLRYRCSALPDDGGEEIIKKIVLERIRRFNELLPLVKIILPKEKQLTLNVMEASVLIKNAITILHENPYHVFDTYQTIAYAFLTFMDTSYDRNFITLKEKLNYFVEWYVNNAKKTKSGVYDSLSDDD